ncbi:hypothetical protein RAB80_011631 [Fusarium oxysporum f. sp. vasinfectum]|nr:hypothetical protein RAB80_011631 [Fusarium oxysporum f. sp. vasinfectum]
MEAGLVNADKLGRVLTNSLCFAIRRWKMIMLSYVFFAAIGSTLLPFTTNKKHLTSQREAGAVLTNDLKRKNATDKNAPR